MVTRISTSIVVLALLLCGTSAAQAAVRRGTQAPEVDARDLQTGGSILLDRLRGRVVLLQFFGTDCPHCRRSVARMNAIYAKYTSRGLVVLALTPDSRDKARAYSRDLGVRHRVARAPMDTLRAYTVAQYPLGVLIAPDGRVLWRGKLERLQDRVLDAYLARVRVLPRPPAAFTLVDDALRARRYGDARRALERLRACADIDRATCRFVLGTLDWIDWHRGRAWKNAADDERRGRWHTAWRTYVDIETSYAGTEDAARAARARAALLADAVRAREIHGRTALIEARRLGRWQAAARAVALLRGVASKHAGTAAATEASQLIAVLSAGR